MMPIGDKGKPGLGGGGGIRTRVREQGSVSSTCLVRINVTLVRLRSALSGLAPI